ncbi:MAG TPA: hypothetical protein VE092_16140 [Herbaspirillum sp.]|uniref:hypothetical protein n=1 Tax=Herbaspirillum sp. TaxID=1890675 RepID=UPI002D6ADBB5|nr:hypothetical protein [Herbaspirillum sp.]HZG21540.1 hypothetical protein [Herbaspirillum sp.]
MTVIRLRNMNEFLTMFALANVLGAGARLLMSLGHSSMPHLLPQPSQNNKNKPTHAAPAKISYHQARGSHVQRSKHPGGGIRSLL